MKEKENIIKMELNKIYGRPKIIAVDFDGTLCENRYPEIGEPYCSVINALKKEQAKGAKLILWTCRVDSHLREAVSWCKKNGLIFDAINENLPETIELFDSDSRKVFADEYWDDRGVAPRYLFREPHWEEVADYCKNDVFATEAEWIGDDRNPQSNPLDLFENGETARRYLKNYMTHCPLQPHWIVLITASDAYRPHTDQMYDFLRKTYPNVSIAMIDQNLLGSRTEYYCDILNTFITLNPNIFIWIDPFMKRRWEVRIKGENKHDGPRDYFFQIFEKNLSEKLVLWMEPKMEHSWWGNIK